MSEWKTGQVGIDLGNVLNVLATALYGNDPKCALRENLQNAHDACVEYVIEGGESFAPEVHVIIDDTSTVKTEDGVEERRPSLVIRDSGIGMTDQDVAQHLAKIGGTTKAMVDEIKKKATEQQRQLAEERIGRFGLGFLAGFIIADRIEVRSCKQGQTGVEAQFTADTEFKYRPAPDMTTSGTEVRLFLLEEFATPSPDNPEQNLSSSDTLKSIIRQYCDLLRFPFFIHRGADARDTGEPVTRNRPPWLNPEPRISDYWNFLKARMPEANDPLSVIPIEVNTSVDAAGEQHPVSARGFVYIPDPPRNEMQEYGVTELYVKRMFIMEDRDQLLPRWATLFCNAIIDTPSLTVTLNRNDVVRQDRAYFQLREEIGRQIIDGLKSMAERKEADFRNLITRHDRRIREAALILDNMEEPSELFKELAEYLPVCVISRDFPPPGELMALRKFVDELAPPINNKPDQRTVKYFSHMSRQMLQNMVSQDRAAVIDATDELHRRFIEAYGATHPDKVVVENIEDGQLSDYVTDVSTKEAERWQPFCAYFQQLTHAGDSVIPRVKNFQPEEVPAIMLEVSAEAAEDQRQALEEFMSKFGGGGAVGRAVKKELDGLRPAGKGVQYMFFLNARNPLMLSLMKVFEASGSTRLPSLVELILHELLHNSRTYAGIPNSLDMTVHIFEHHSQLMDRILQSHERIMNLEKQQAEFSNERVRLQQELHEVGHHLTQAIKFSADNGYEIGLPDDVVEKHTSSEATAQ